MNITLMNTSTNFLLIHVQQLLPTQFSIPRVRHLMNTFLLEEVKTFLCILSCISKCCLNNLIEHFFCKNLK